MLFQRLHNSFLFLSLPIQTYYTEIKDSFANFGWTVIRNFHRLFRGLKLVAMREPKKQTCVKDLPVLLQLRPTMFDAHLFNRKPVFGNVIAILSWCYFRKFHFPFHVLNDTKLTYRHLYVQIISKNPS